MPVETINLNISIKWEELKNEKGMNYICGDEKNSKVDPNWLKINLIYRWVKNSNNEIADIGETERTIKKRVDNYLYGKPESSSGSVNKKVFAEHQRLMQNNDGLRLEFTGEITGFNLQDQRERRLAERLLHGYYKPYLQ
jgi:hypothetical protein